MDKLTSDMYQKYQQGWTFYEIGQVYGMSKQGVHWRLKHEGCKLRTESAAVSERKQRILDFTRAYIDANGRNPSLKEISLELFGTDNRYGNVSRWCDQLIVEGFLCYEDGSGRGTHRALQLCDPQPRARYYEVKEVE